MAPGGGRAKSTTSSTTTTTTNKHLKPNKKNNSNKLSQVHLNSHLLSLLSSATSAAATFLHNNELLLLPSQSLTLESLILSLSPSPPPPPPPPCFFTRLKNADNTDKTLWPTFFRMSKPTFSLLLSLLSPSLSSSLPSIPPDFALAAALFRLAHNAPYAAAARRFGMDTHDSCRAFFTVCKAVCDNMGDFIAFEGVKGFELLKNCCGVLGFGRFGKVLVQALVDSQGRFLDVSAGWPSVLKPEFILRRSSLFACVEGSREMLNGPCCEVGDDGKMVREYVLGDACFPLLPWLLTPYRTGENGDGGEFGLSEREFNSVHRDAMGLVRMAFGRVRARWRLLAKRWKDECLEYLPYVIVMGCLLHNFLIKCDEPVPDDIMGSTEEEELPVFQGELDEGGQRIRDVVAEHLSQAR